MRPQARLRCVSWGECVPVARKLQRRSRLPPRSVLGAPHRGAAPEAAAETKSFCPCHKTGGNTGFSPVLFFHVLHGYVVHFGSNSGFSHPVLPVLNRFHPLQHPKRTRFRLFRPKPGAFRCFYPLLTCKIFGSVFVRIDIHWFQVEIICDSSQPRGVFF